MKTEFPVILNSLPLQSNRKERSCFFGDFSSLPSTFVFLPDEKELIHFLVGKVKNIVDDPEENNKIGYFADLSRVPQYDESYELELFHSIFGYVFNDSSEQIPFNFDENNNDTTNFDCNVMQQISPTHQVLLKLMKIADQNEARTKPGYRYDSDIKSFATYIRILGGPLLYETIQSNLKLALPSLDTTNRFIRKMEGAMIDGCLRSVELLKYLTDRNLPLVVSISEDATRIDGRIQYDSKTNQVSGFVLPLDNQTGMPIPFSFKARNATEMLKHFTSNTPIAHFVNVIMARPLANYPAFCLLLFSSDGRYTAEDVMKRWDFIIRELSMFGIKVLTISSDSDPRYNSAMRKCTSLGLKSHIFNEEDWFCCGLSKLSDTVYFQDIVHLITKLRNLSLKTKNDPGKLPFGDYYIQIGHLKHLLEHYAKDEHELTPSVLNPIDRQNYQSARRMYSDKVITLLRNHVPGSEGTVSFLMMMRDLSDSFYDPKLSPLQRVNKVWYVTFLLRIWRHSIQSNEQLTLKDNFLTQNCYSCVEINAHSLVHVLVYLKETDLKAWFLPFIFDSQACESFFRQIRSLTTVFSTVANCSAKEIVGRINRIQLLNEITHTTEFSFPRIKDTLQFPEAVCFELPTMKEILAEISKARAAAIDFAIEVGLLNEDQPDISFTCQIPPIGFSDKPTASVYLVDYSNEKYLNTIAVFMELSKGTKLKNYAHKFAGKQISEESPFVEICNDEAKRIVVKKSSLCWLLREDPGKLSSDRLQRVRGSITYKRKKSFKRMRLNMKSKKIVIRQKKHRNHMIYKK